MKSINSYDLDWIWCHYFHNILINQTDIVHWLCWCQFLPIFQVSLFIVVALFPKRKTRNITIRDIIVAQQCLAMWVGWLVMWPWNMSIILCGSFFRTSSEYSFTIHEFRLNLEVWVEIYSRQFSHELWFIPIIYIYSINSKTLIEYDDTIFTIFLLFKPTLFIGCVGVNFFLFSKFLPVKER